MARLFVACLVLLASAMTVAAAKEAPAPAATAGDAGDCNSDLQDLVANCQNYVMFPAEPKITPSPACCAVIKRADIPCLCAKVTPQIEQVVCMDKVVFVAAYCGRPFQPGSNCGSYHVPGLIA